MKKNRQNLLFFLTRALITGVFIIVFIAPSQFAWAQNQNSNEAQKLTYLQNKIEELRVIINNLQTEFLKIIETKIKLIEKEIAEIKINISQLSEGEKITPEPISEPTPIVEIKPEETAKEEPTTYTGGGAPSIPTLPPPSPPTPIPIQCSPPIASGVQTYSVTTKDNPKITQVDIDPLDVQKFASQTVNVKISETNGKPITEVTGKAITDNSSFHFTLSLIAGTNTNGTWQGSWSNQDSYCQNYMLIITATSESGQSKVELAFR